MKWPTILAIYFTTWWTVLFGVLPFGVRNAAETGRKVEQGQDPGAPVTTGLVWKAVVTSVLAALVTAGIIWAVNSNLFGL